jgi:hypothetical protein
MKGLPGWKSTWRAAAACLLVAIAVLATGMASQRDTEAKAAERPNIVVDGTDWAEATERGRLAFLVGVGNMIVADLAYAQTHEVEPSPVSTMIVDAVSDLTLEDIEETITRWYDAHPDKMDMPVMGVIWLELVKKSEAK